MAPFEPTLHLVDVPGSEPADPLLLLPLEAQRAAFVFNGGEWSPEDRAVWEAVTHSGWFCLSRDGLSSARTLGALAFSLLPGGEVLMVHSDDPLLQQLAGPRARVHAPARGEVLGPEEVKRDLGVEPWQIPDYLALVGCPALEAHGALGVDEPLARAILERFAGVEELTARPDLLELLETPSAERLRALLRKQGERLKGDAARLNLHTGERIAVAPEAFRRRKYANLI
jgi:5'-3' exonuclease